MTMLLFVVVVLLFVYYYRQMKKTYSLFGQLGIPGPKPLWIFGNIHEFRDTDKLEMFKVWRKRFGDVYGYFEGFKPSIVICNPELSRLILVKYFEKFHIRPPCNPFLYYPDEHSLINVHGPKWKAQRTAVVTALNSVPMNIVVKRMSKKCCELIDILTQETANHTDGLNIESITDKFTLDAFSYGVFEYEVDSMHNENEILYRYMNVLYESSAVDNPTGGLARVYDSLKPFLQLFDTKHRDIHTKHIHELRELIENRLKKPSTDNVLDCLLQTTIPANKSTDNVDCQQRNLTTEEILGHLNSIIAGGFGQTNAALAFVLHQLTVHQDIQEKLFEEIKHHCGLFDELDMACIQNLKYLDCVIYETLRTLPNAPGVARECAEDCTINGIQFKKGIVIRIMLCALYVDKNIYPDPTKFIPERFTEEERDKRHPNTFLPFGQGPRICPGFKLATILMKLAIIVILRNFILTPCDRTEDPLPTALRPMLVPKNGVHIKVLSRNNNKCS